MSENKQMQPFLLVNYKKGQGPLLHGTVGIIYSSQEEQLSMYPAVKSNKSCWVCLFSFFIWTAALAKENAFGFTFS